MPTPKRTSTRKSTRNQPPNKPTTRTRRPRSSPKKGAKRTTKPTLERVNKWLTRATKTLLLIFLAITLTWAIYDVGERIGIPFRVAHAIVLTIDYFERFFQ